MNLEAIFHAALERRSPAERAAYLDGACGGDASLRGRVEALLVAHDRSPGFLDEPLVTPPSPLAEAAGTRIGRYKLLQLIGEGGMGAVYMAEQEEPVRRKVALKIIKLGMDTKQVIARFEAERQALAMMDHPNIARVLEAGATETGRPYFVMELVRGIPIAEYCDQAQMTTRERLELFVPVCRAIQHAHQKGVIHRDIKPSNVLVTLHDGVAMPKVIDFGIAKATSQRLTEKTLFTEFRQFVGTPEYMSPEQAEMSGLDVDTRTDIYALGVLLYELLTGTTPFEAKRLRESGYGELQRIIREEEPPSLSARASQLGDALEALARRRKTEPRELLRGLRGDLDWIVMKALEKDRTRRYDSPSELAADVGRHLALEPVLAGPPGAFYRARKFVHRHRRGVLGAAAAALTLAVGLGIASVGLWRARAEERRSQRIGETLQELLAAVDPKRTAASGADVESVLATSRDVFGDDHATSASLLNAMAIQLQNAGDLEGAEPLYRESIERWTQLSGADSLNVALVRVGLGVLLIGMGREDEAEANLRESIEVVAGRSEASALAACEPRLALAELLGRRGDHGAAIEQLELAASAMRSVEPLPLHRLLQVLGKLAEPLLYSEPERAEPVLREIYGRARECYPEGSVYLATTALGLGNYLAERGRIAEGREYLREAVERYRRLDEAPQIVFLLALDRLFQAVRNDTGLEDRIYADGVLAECIEQARPVWSAKQLVENLAFLGHRLGERGAYVEGLEALREALALARAEELALQHVTALERGVALGALRIGCSRSHAPGVLEAARVDVAELLDQDPQRRVSVLAAAALEHRLGRQAESLELLERFDRCERTQRSFERELDVDVLALRCLVHAALGSQAAARDWRDRLQAERARADAPAEAEAVRVALFAEAAAAAG